MRPLTDLLRWSGLSTPRLDSIQHDQRTPPNLQVAVIPVPLAELPIAIHAHRLLLWVKDCSGREILASELLARYREMCCELAWREHRWEGRGGVAQYARALGGHDKVYRWFTFPDGSRHRLHVYPIAWRKEPAQRWPDRVTRRTPSRSVRTPVAVAAMRIGLCCVGQCERERRRRTT